MYRQACDQNQEIGVRFIRLLRALLVFSNKQKRGSVKKMDGGKERGWEGEREGLGLGVGWNERLPDADRWEVQALISGDNNFHDPCNRGSGRRHA